MTMSDGDAEALWDAAPTVEGTDSYVRLVVARGQMSMKSVHLPARDGELPRCSGAEGSGVREYPNVTWTEHSYPMGWLIDERLCQWCLRTVLKEDQDGQ